LAAAWLGHESSLRNFLLQAPEIDVNFKDPLGQTALSLAFQRGHMGVTRVLLEHPTVDVNCVDAKGVSLLTLPSDRRTPLNPESFKLLCQHERLDPNKPDKYGRTPLYDACEKGRPERVEALLLNSRLEVSKPTSYNKTPLEIACEKGFLDIGTLLIADSRSDITRVGNFGKTPFFITCEQGHIELARLLLDKGSLNQRDNSGSSPLLIACQKGFVPIVELLTSDPRLDVNKPSHSGLTPFHEACSSGRLDILKLMFRTQANVSTNVKTELNGSTPAEIAKEKGFTEITALIAAYERDPKRLREQLWAEAAAVPKSSRGSVEEIKPPVVEEK